jgi:hypothetical protein
MNIKYSERLKRVRNSRFLYYFWRRKVGGVSSLLTARNFVQKKTGNLFKLLQKIYGGAAEQAMVYLEAKTTFSAVVWLVSENKLPWKIGSTRWTFSTSGMTEIRTPVIYRASKLWEGKSEICTILVETRILTSFQGGSHWSELQDPGGGGGGQEKRK